MRPHLTSDTYGKKKKIESYDVSPFSWFYVFSLSWQDDEVVLQCVATIQKEHRKFCLAAEGLGNRLCYLEPTSEAKV